MDTQPNNPSDFELLTAIVSRVTVGYDDLERIFPRAERLSDILGRLVKASRIEMFGTYDTNYVQYAVPGYLEDHQ